MKLRAFPLVCLLLFAAACGGGGGGSPAAPKATPTISPPASPTATATSTPSPASTGATPSPVPTGSPGPTATPSPSGPTAPPFLAPPYFEYYNFASSQPQDIVSAPDGNVWFTQAFFGEVAFLSPNGETVSYPVLTNGPSTEADPQGIALGSDRTLWIANRSNSSISNIALSGALRSVNSLGSVGPSQIAFGADGNLWFTQTTPSIVGRMTPAGAYTSIAVPQAVTGIVAGADGNLWLSAGTSGVIRLSTAGDSTVFAPPTGSNVQAIGVGSDGNIWAGGGSGEFSGVTIFKISPAGLYTTYAMGGYLGLGVPRGWIVTAIYSAGGYIYFVAVEPAAAPNDYIVPSIITQLTTSGAVAQQYSVPPLGGSNGDYISSMTLGADGNLWFVDQSAQTIDVWVFASPPSVRSRQRNR